MPDRPMEGVRILEVAQFTFTPAAGAVLADWGADVIKVEHADRPATPSAACDSAWRLPATGLVPARSWSTRTAASAASASRSSTRRRSRCSTTWPGRSDVFLTNFLPDARERLRIDVDDIRAVNPDIIYVRGQRATAQRGPEAEKGGYDGTAFWCRGGRAVGGHAARLRRA